MQHFVTNFNLRFLPQGLALHKSMKRHISDFVLWVVCMDQDCFDALQKLNLAFIRPINFVQHESVPYKLIRSQRTIAEYCWTVNPINPQLVFSADSSVEQVTYIDADMWFINSPQFIFEEFASSKKSVMLTEHGYLPQYNQTNTSGQYCAQWITYRRNDSEPLRKWWEEQCFSWCFNRFENGKFGDQKYLEQWPTLFPGQVHVLSRAEWILAPWNADDSCLSNAVAHHFHGLRILDQGHYALRASYHISDRFKGQIYHPYLEDLRRGIQDMGLIGLPLISQIGESWINQNNRVQSFLKLQMAKAADLRVESFGFT